jgi:hypothetical protein
MALQQLLEDVQSKLNTLLISNDSDSIEGNRQKYQEYNQSLDRFRSEVSSILENNQTLLIKALQGKDWDEYCVRVSGFFFDHDLWCFDSDRNAKFTRFGVTLRSIQSIEIVEE